MVGRRFAAVNARVGTRTLVWAALLAILALVLDFVPLFDVLGYDFAFALGLGAALAGVDVGQGVVARWRRAAGAAAVPDPGVVLGLVGRAIALALATLA